VVVGLEDRDREDARKARRSNRIQTGAHEGTPRDPNRASGGGDESAGKQAGDEAGPLSLG